MTSMEKKLTENRLTEVKAALSAKYRTVDLGGEKFFVATDGVFGLGVVLFPCSVSWIPEGTPVGFFQIPIEISQYLHNGCASLFFLLIAFNSYFLFTKSDGVMTSRKVIRNRIYRLCGGGMLLFEILFAILSLCDAPGYSVMIIEIILLHLFGFSWLTKGEAFPCFNAAS